MAMKTVIDRHEQLLRERLEQMTPRHAVAFAASCAEILSPNYQTFASDAGWGDPAELDSAIAAAWRFASGTTIEPTVIADLVERCTAIAPDTETFDEISVSAALNSVSAAVAALESCL